MRNSLADPISDSSKLTAAVALSDRLYRLHEAGQPCAPALQQLADLVGKGFDDVKLGFIGAFGSVGPKTLACRLLVDWSRVPNDLSREEMLELLERIFAPKSSKEFSLEYWLRCLRVNTKNDRISDLIFWPGEYFGDGDDGRIMTPDEILDTALSGKQ